MFLPVGGAHDIHLWPPHTLDHSRRNGSIMARQAQITDSVSIRPVSRRVIGCSGAAVTRRFCL
jgi:hypothetical protein